MATVSLSTEEENYVRMSLLLTGISPRGVRVLFDREFAPICLDGSIKKEYKKLKELQLKHIINQSQWNLLFPRYPDVPDSKTFDTTLMITLLRNLTPMIPPHCGYDKVPKTSETTRGADLARIKYYRNYLAHLDDGHIDTTFFNTAWTDISGAIDRLGGQKMKLECDQLKIKPLDQTNHEIMMDIKRSNDEIRELKGSLESLKLSYIEIKKSHEEVKTSHALLQEKVASSHQDTVPWNVRAQINKILAKWKIKDKMFVDTRAAHNVLLFLQEKSCVTITASSGVGKTATLRHVALQMGKDGYDILLVTDPGDIVKFYNPNQKTLFVIDDLCGNFSLNQADIKIWEPVICRLKEFLEEKLTKIIVACRLQVYQDDKFDTLSIFKTCVFNLLSFGLRLTTAEKEAIAEVHLQTKAKQITDYYNLYDCFPLLCQLYHENPTLDIKDFFKNPFSVFGAQVDQLQKKGFFGKYCALALCVVFNNKLNESMLKDEINEETRIIIENVCESCRLDRGTSRLLLKDELDSLLHTFLSKVTCQTYYTMENHRLKYRIQRFYTTIHDKVFDFLAKYFGQKIIHCLIKNADSCLIRERFLLKSPDDTDQFITIVPTEYHELYMQRMVDDWLKGKLQDVFNNSNMKIYQFRKRFLCYLNKFSTSYQKQLVHTLDADNILSSSDQLSYCEVVCDTVMLHCCFIGDFSMIQWCCNHEVDVNQCGSYGQSPLSLTCRYGGTEIARMLLDKGADYNTCDSYGETFVMIACKNGHTEIVSLLLNKGADYDKCNSLGQSPLMIVCGNGHKEMVSMLLEKGADYNRCDSLGQSSLMIACGHGQFEVVKMLLDIGADYNKCSNKGQSPVMTACRLGHTEILRILLDKGEDNNKCNNFGQSLVFMACRYGHTNMVGLLLNNGVDYNKCDNYGQTPIMIASETGCKDIVRMLIDNGADYKRCDISGDSPLILACRECQIEIVWILLERGANYDNCDKYGQSPLLVACNCGHTTIVNMLLEKGADYNNCSNYGQSPVLMACRYGHTEIVRKLLEKGAEYDKCDCDGQSPIFMACMYGHKDVVGMLLDKGADYTKCDVLGQSPLHAAHRHCHREIVWMLIEKGNDKKRPIIFV